MTNLFYLRPLMTFLTLSATRSSVYGCSIALIPLKKAILNWSQPNKSQSSYTLVIDDVFYNKASCFFCPSHQPIQENKFPTLVGNWEKRKKLLGKYSCHCMSRKPVGHLNWIVSWLPIWIPLKENLQVDRLKGFWFSLHEQTSFSDQCAGAGKTWRALF